ncbi:MAG: (d)CMP kinase, partial [Casimicrobiaceae bacterium]
MSAQSPPTVIAIDGPAASGKGTIALRVARALGYRYLDSGSMYRLVALKALERKVAADDALGLAELAATLAPEFDGGRIGLQGRDVSEALRSEAVSALASRVA